MHCFFYKRYGDSSDPSQALWTKMETNGLPVRPHGCVWDIGAHNGIFSSNSYFLIHRKQYVRAYLFEPQAREFSLLTELSYAWWKYMLKTY